MKSPHPRNADDYTPHPAVLAPTDPDRVGPTGPAADAPSAMLGEIARAAENLMLADLKYVNDHFEPEEDPTLNDMVQISEYITLPTLDDREPIAVPMVAPPIPGSPDPSWLDRIRNNAHVPRPMLTPAPIPPLFVPGGTPPGPAELRAVMRTQGDELIDHGRMLVDLSLRDHEPAEYVAKVLAYREGDISGVAQRIGMLGRLFARLGIEGDGRPRGA